MTHESKMSEALRRMVQREETHALSVLLETERMADTAAAERLFPPDVLEAWKNNERLRTMQAVLFPDREIIPMELSRERIQDLMEAPWLLRIDLNVAVQPGGLGKDSRADAVSHASMDQPLKPNREEMNEDDR